ncbi:hypothetical protein ACFFIF_10755 [Vagococcus entomophilus]|uniref:DUF1310 domain-containing protein n=1 Tax=Vagococcus entomophilus TaxID=1160095 RepID=A0A430AF19_9ENTE|nr:hypothetical protein [Vagococcus entomophilus]RSU06170.1 hypothetical protein CBF30_10660 [Vagococcus entomophilus]
MKKKKWIWLIIGVIIILGGIGGKVYMDKRAEHSKKELIEVERQSVKALKNTFTDISEVRVERIGFNKMTGFYRLVIVMTNDKGNSVFFDYGFIKNDNELSDYSVIDRGVQEKGITKGSVKVTYSNGEEEEI